MRRILQIFVLAILLFIGCTRAESVFMGDTKESGKRIYSAMLGSDTKVYIEEGTLFWSAEDRISIFDDKGSNMQYRYTGATGVTIADFEYLSGGGSPISLGGVYALYPYTQEAVQGTDATISTTLPYRQLYAFDSFGLGAQTMVAATSSYEERGLSFRSVNGVLKLQLYGNDIVVKRLTLKGNNGELLSGSATVTPSFDKAPSVVMNESAKGVVAIDCGDGVSLSPSSAEPTTFWFTLPPTTFQKGFKVTLVTTDNRGVEFATSKSLSVARNTIHPMAVLEVKDLRDIQPGNELWYTTSDAAVLTIGDADMGQRVLSNNYSDGVGVVVCEEDITSIPQGAMKGESRLRRVELPNSVNSIGSSAFADCAQLSEFYCRAEVPPTLGEGVFDGSLSNLKIYVTESLLSAYKEAWNEYRDYIYVETSVITPIFPEVGSVEIMANQRFGYQFDANLDWSISITEGAEYASLLSGGLEVESIDGSAGNGLRVFGVVKNVKNYDSDVSFTLSITMGGITKPLVIYTIRKIDKPTLVKFMYEVEGTTLVESTSAAAKYFDADSYYTLTYTNEYDANDGVPLQTTFEYDSITWHAYNSKGEMTDYTANTASWIKVSTFGSMGGFRVKMNNLSSLAQYSLKDGAYSGYVNFRDASGKILLSLYCVFDEVVNEIEFTLADAAAAAECGITLTGKGLEYRITYTKAEYLQNGAAYGSKVGIVIPNFTAGWFAIEGNLDFIYDRQAGYGYLVPCEGKVVGKNLANGTYNMTVYSGSTECILSVVIDI